MEDENKERKASQWLKNENSDRYLLDLFDSLQSEEKQQEMFSTDFDESIHHIHQEEIRSEYEQLYQKIQAPKSRWKVLKKMDQWLKYSAVFVIAILLSTLVQQQYGPQPNNQAIVPANEMVLVMEKGNKGNVQLADGTKVWLNGESKLQYSNTKEREVSLEGQAYFEVAHQPENEFVVHTAYFDIVVYGTSFNVSAYTGDEIVDVALTEGEIGVRQTNKAMLKISPGQAIQYNKTTEKLVVINKDMTDVALWRNNELVLRDLNASQLYAKLSAWYGVHIQPLNSAKKQHLYNLVLRHETINQTLELINKLSPITYTITGKEVQVRYK